MRSTPTTLSIVRGSAAGTHSTPYTKRISGVAKTASSTQAGIDSVMRIRNDDANPDRCFAWSPCNWANPATDTLLIEDENAVTGQLERLNAIKYSPSATGPRMAPTTM